MPVLPATPSVWKTYASNSGSSVQVSLDATQNKITVPFPPDQGFQNFTDANQLATQCISSFQCTATVTGGVASSGNDEIAIFQADATDVGGFNGHEVGFVVNIDGTLHGYFQDNTVRPNVFTTTSTIGSPDGLSHLYAWTISYAGGVNTFQYYIDGVLKGTLTYTGVDYSQLQSHVILTCHRWTTGWSSPASWGIIASNITFTGTQWTNPEVAVKNLLYNKWAIYSPAQDTGKIDTTDPSKVHFTNRWYAYTPLRIHPFQISVRPLNKPYRAMQLGYPTKYYLPENITIHVWVLPNPQLSIEDAHTILFNISQEIRRIIRVNGETAGSNIQHIVLGAWQDRSELDRDPPRLHIEARMVCHIFETSSD